MLQKIAPVLSTKNISETNLFFRNKLKFDTRNYGNYLVVKKDEIEIHFSQCSCSGDFVKSVCCVFDNNIEDLYAKFCSMDMISPAGNLKNNLMGKKEFCIIDNNGHELRFAEI